MRIKTDPKVSYIEGVNVFAAIQAIAAWSDGPRANELVYLEDIGKRDNPISGGLAVTPSAMDELCQKWLETRGYTVAKAGQENAAPTYIVWTGDDISSAGPFATEEERNAKLSRMYDWESDEPMHLCDAEDDVYYLDILPGGRFDMYRMTEETLQGEEG
jgi:hypothetical protein